MLILGVPTAISPQHRPGGQRVPQHPPKGMETRPHHSFLGCWPPVSVSEQVMLMDLCGSSCSRLAQGRLQMLNGPGQTGQRASR